MQSRIVFFIMRIGFSLILTGENLNKMAELLFNCTIEGRGKSVSEYCNPLYKYSKVSIGHPMVVFSRKEIMFLCFYKRLNGIVSIDINTKSMNNLTKSMNIRFRNRLFGFFIR